MWSICGDHDRPSFGLRRRGDRRPCPSGRVLCLLWCGRQERPCSDEIHPARPRPDGRLVDHDPKWGDAGARSYDGDRVGPVDLVLKAGVDIATWSEHEATKHPMAVTGDIAWRLSVYIIGVLGTGSIVAEQLACRSVCEINLIVSFRYRRQLCSRAPRNRST